MGVLMASKISVASGSCSSDARTWSQLSSTASINGCMKKKRSMGRRVWANGSKAAATAAVLRSAGSENSSSMSAGRLPSNPARGRGHTPLVSRFQNRYRSPLPSTKIWLSMTPPLNTGCFPSSVRPVVLYENPASSGFPQSRHGPSGWSLLAIPIASALLCWRAV